MDITWLLTTVCFNFFRTESSFKLARTVFCPNWPPAIADWGVARPLTPSVLVSHGVFALAIEADDTSRLIDSVVNGCPMLKACMRLVLNEEAPLVFSLWNFCISPIRSAALLENIQQVLRTVQNCARPAIAGVISFISDDSQFTAIFFFCHGVLAKNRSFPCLIFPRRMWRFISSLYTDDLHVGYHRMKISFRHSLYEINWKQYRLCLLIIRICPMVLSWSPW